MDALTVREGTGLPYASNQTATDREGKTVPVMHASGHDMHVTWLVGAAVINGKRNAHVRHEYPREVLGRATAG